MAPLNTRTAAVINPILSNHARGYHNSTFISNVLFPRVPVPNRAMSILKFGKEAFRKLNTRRAPGSNVKRVQYGYGSDTISLLQDSLEAVVPIEHQQEAEKVPGIDLGANAVNMVLDVVDLGLEYDAAQLARTSGNYDANHKLALTGTDRWSNAASDPGDDIRSANEAIRRFIGRRANVLTLGPSAAAALKNHPKVKEQFKYVSKDSITLDMLAAFFELEKVIAGDAVYLPEGAADSVQATDIWGDDAILAYVPQTGGNFMVPSYGYTYELLGYPQVEEPYYSRETKSWIYPTTTERRPYLVGADAGFLFQNAGAA
ncbi:major capsid protein [Pseudorhodobacter sp.]|uniref:major capsid protein n=1 Tax=Pseudorhodobacter sp. TaxID=1934400 RepID=UPI002648EA61|nr:major capsid protein [Pseudorhodobacter sp.]MDN5786389.1 major capsid protein [Pseudorhodobacter sp.]